MKDFVSSPFLKKYKILLMAGLISLILIGSVYYVLNAYFEKAAHEVVENWYANELTSIQQGNVLSSVTKLQRTLDKSALIKGVKVIDKSGHELVRFGKVPQETFRSALSNEISREDLGLFENVYGFKSGDLDIFVITESRGLLVLVGILGLYLILVMFGFAFFIRRNSLKEEKLRTEISIQRIRLESEFNERIANISRSVAHDIRSPLSVLNIISNKMKATSAEEGILLSDVSTRIMQIADGLLDVSRKTILNEVIEEKIESTTTQVSLSSQGVATLCERAISEKRLELGDSSVKLQYYNEVNQSFDVICEPLELSRILSNLLNNSVEAIHGAGFVSLTFSERDESVLIEIRDSGKGMNQDLIEKVMKCPVSEGKEKGNGLGLWPAIVKVKEWNGELKIKSDRGTTIAISLKRL